jgi:light-regulated signal transduction histidine kinase (bacteriophytochrome)
MEIPVNATSPFEPASPRVMDESATERQLIRVQERLEQAERDICDVDTDLHLLRNSLANELHRPVRELRSLAQVLQNDHGASMSAAVRLGLERMTSGLVLADQLVDDLLHLTAIGRLPVRRRIISLNASLSAAMRQLAPLHQSRSIEWQLEDLSQAICDSDCATRIFACLLSNALKFTETCSPAKIRIGEMQLENERVVFVEDNGLDFGTQLTPTRMEMFNCVATAGESRSPSASIALAARIVRRLGGRMWSQSRANVGVTFLFTLAPTNADDSEHERG